MRSGKKFTLGFPLTLVALVSMLLASCDGAGPTNNTGTKLFAAPKAQQTYRIGLLATDISLDSALATNLYEAQPLLATFTGLVQLNDQLQVVPQLAQTLPFVSADGLSYTFTLKPNLKFSDGTPLTAQDVAYSIDRALSPALANMNGITLTYLGLIKDAAKRSKGNVSTLIGDSLIVVNPMTIKIVVEKRTAYFLQALTYPTGFVVEQKVINQWSTRWTDHLSDNGGQGGDGPWKVQSYSHTTGITLIPNPNYYGKTQTLQKLVFAFYKDTHTMYLAYLANQLDTTLVPPADDAQAEAKVKEFRKAPSLVIYYLAMNYLYKPFDNIDIRQALSLAINRDAIAKSIYNNLVIPTCHIVPNGMPGYNPNLTCAGDAPTKGDPARAQQLFSRGLAAESLTRATFPRITLVYPTGTADIADVITTVIGMWSSILGITIIGRAENFNQIQNDINQTGCPTPTDQAKCQNKGLAMWWFGWIADYPDAQDPTTLQFDNGAPDNTWNYGQNLSANASEQQAVQRELEKADTDFGSDRLSLYNDAEQKLVNDVAWLSLDQPFIVGLIKPYIHGMVNNAEDLTPPDDWANIYVTAH